MYPNFVDLKRKFQPVDYADKDLWTVSRREATSVTQLTSAFSCDLRYMPSLSVFRKNKPLGLELGAANIDPNNQKIQDKIEAALKVVRFREQHVLVQFWWPHEFGKHQILTAIDQPFGVGVLDAGLSLYRQDSEGRSFVVDKDHEEEDHSPAARVFRRRLPEWTSDLNNYTPNHFPQQECAINCNLHGYLALPVFYSNTPLCVGVLELLTSSKYTSYAYEVQQLHNALETQNLISPQVIDFPSFDVPNESRQNNLDKIYGILKMACKMHSLPLAQTWAVSQHTSFVSHEKVMQKSCSSFDTRCVGKVCMSTADLPFHVLDLAKWPFFKACRERHMDVSCGVVGKALSTRGSCFCGDVTKLSEAEYPLVHNACMNRLTSSFAIYFGSVEANDEYVLEFYLPPDIRDSGQVSNLVQTLKQNIPMSSGFELGDTSCTVLSVNMEPDVIQTSLDYVADNFTSSDSKSSMANPTNLSIEKMGKKRKIEWLTEMVTAEITHYCNMKKFHFSVSSGLTHLENEVSRSFKLKGKKLRLKYMDEEDDLILITSDDDLMYAVATTGTNNSINLTCLSD